MPLASDNVAGLGLRHIVSGLSYCCIASCLSTVTAEQVATVSVSAANTASNAFFFVFIYFYYYYYFVSIIVHESDPALCKT